MSMIKLVIADDEQIIRESLAALINWRSLGIELAGVCKNGVEALECIIDTCPGIVITDIKMPGLNGLKLIEKIRQTDQDIQIIVLSGYGEFEFAKTAMQYGVKYYLLKPINNDAIRQAVEKAKKDFTDAETVRPYLSSSLILSQKSQSVSGKIKEYVEKNLSSDHLTLKWLAANYLYMNADHISRQFVIETGEKFSTYLNRTRMEFAKELLKQHGLNRLADIAEQVGCGDNVRYFSQLFKKYIGMTPTAYINSLVKTD